MQKYSEIDISIIALCGRIKLRTATKQLMEKIIWEENSPLLLFDELIESCCTQGSKARIRRLPAAEKLRILGKYVSEIGEVIKKNKMSLVLPSVDDEETAPCLLEPEAFYEKLVADHLHISVLEVENLNYLEYCFWRAEAVKYNLSGSEKGRQMLNAAYFALCSGEQCSEKQEENLIKRE